MLMILKAEGERKSKDIFSAMISISNSLLCDFHWIFEAKDFTKHHPRRLLLPTAWVIPWLTDGVGEPLTFIINAKLYWVIAQYKKNTSALSN